MYRPKSQRRLSKGDRVRPIKGSFMLLGDGVVEKVGIHTHRSLQPLLNVDSDELEMVEEDILTAEVRFDDGTVARMPLHALVTCHQAELYESLEEGDFIVFGKSKRAAGIVLSNLPKKIPGGITRSVSVLEDGIKRNLSIEREIISVQRARDYIGYDPDPDG